MRWWSARREEKSAFVTVDVVAGAQYPVLVIHNTGPAAAREVTVTFTDPETGNPSAMTTLNTYGHMWPDADESARAAVAVVLAARADSVAGVGASADNLRTNRASG